MDINKIAALLTQNSERGVSFPSGTMHPSRMQGLRAGKSKGRSA